MCRYWKSSVILKGKIDSKKIKYDNKIEHGYFTLYCFQKNLYSMEALTMHPNFHFVLRFVVFLED